MKQQEFIDYLKYPNVLEDSSIPSLNKIVETFPYFQTARLLFAKNLHNQNNIHYNEQLKIAAVYAPDRTVLYNLIYNYNPEFTTSVFNQEKTTQEVTSLKIETELIIHKETLSIPLENSSELIINPIEVENTKEDIENTKQEARNKKQETEASQQLFSDWLIRDTKIISNINKPPTAIAETLNPIIGDQQKFPEKEKKQLSSHELIDQFIKTEPKIIPSKADFYSPAVKAKESLKEHDDFFSETLAKIYAKQGTTVKAIYIYEKLSLKYPEKSTYFADQIKKLKDSQTS
jgi:hypothetical protein